MSEKRTQILRLAKKFPSQLIKTIKKGKFVTNAAKEAPAPKATNIAGRAQHINVDEDANNDRKFTDLSSIN